MGNRKNTVSDTCYSSQQPSKIEAQRGGGGCYTTLRTCIKNVCIQECICPGTFKRTLIEDFTRSYNFFPRIGIQSRGEKKKKNSKLNVCKLIVQGRREVWQDETSNGPSVDRRSALSCSKDRCTAFRNLPRLSRRGSGACPRVSYTPKRLPPPVRYNLPFHILQDAATRKERTLSVLLVKALCATSVTVDHLLLVCTEFSGQNDSCFLERMEVTS